MDKRVLIVDDDPTVLALLGRLLESAGYVPLTARDGRQALHVILEKSPPIVLTDWLMPNVDGIQLCKTLREHEGVGFVYVVILTAITNQDAVAAAMEAGADDFLYKPVTKEELLLRLRSGFRVVELQNDLAGRTREAHLQNARLVLAGEKLETANRTLARMATTDELTGLTNRREAMSRLDELWQQSGRFGEPLACVVADIDHFKSVNDTYGHAVGDVVLKATAQTMSATTRAGERVCRVGGEEFLLICPRSTLDMAGIAAERLRAAVASTPVLHGGRELRVTISLGVAGRTGVMSRPDELLVAADEALYQAKAQGRNRVCQLGQEDERRIRGRVPAASLHDVVRVAGEYELESDRSGVLLVEPDDAVRRHWRGLLEHEGCVVHEARDGPEALDALRSHACDVVVLEQNLARLDGLSTVRRLKSDPATRDAAVILLAGAGGGGVGAIDALRAGADALLTTPVNLDELMHRLRAALTTQAGRKALVRSNDVRAEQARTFELLLEYSRQLVSAESLDVVLDSTLDVTAKLTCSRRISIMLPDERGRRLSIVRALGVPDEVVAATSLAVGEGIAGRVFQTGEMVVMDDVARRSVDISPYVNGAYVCAPLVRACMGSEARIVGVLNITERNQGRAYLPLELECIDMVCNIAASAINDLLARRARDEARDSVVFALAKLAEHRDSETGRHLERVTRFSRVLAEDLGRMAPFHDRIDEAFLKNLQRAVPLHDIGKVAIPDNILLKSGRLTPEEMAVMRTHVQVGANTIQSVLDRTPGVDFLQMALDVTAGHHEWFDGRGYPNGSSGDAIPLAARIVALADVYDALTTRRAYKPAYAHDRARAIILRSSGTQFDPAVVDAFVRQEGQFIRLAAELADEQRDERGDLDPECEACGARDMGDQTAAAAAL